MNNKNFMICSERKEVPYFLLKELEKSYLDRITGVYTTLQGYFSIRTKPKNLTRNFRRKKSSSCQGSYSTDRNVR